MTLAPDRAATGRLSGSGVADLIARRVPGHALEGPFYAGQEVYEADLAAVWGRTWLFAATEADVREPGDFVTVNVGPWSVIVVRDDDEQVQALHNVCRHRGTRLLTEDAGSVGNLVCGYHRWTYAPDGTLLHAGEQPPGFDKSCFGLRHVAVRVVAGLVFICLADDPPDDVDEVMDRIAPYVAPHQLGRAKVAARVDLVEHANWKLVMENNRECYHCDNAHPELVRTFFPTWGYAEADIPKRLWPAHERFLAADAELAELCAARGLPRAEIEELDRVTGFRIQREPLDGAGESYTLDGTAACTRLLADFDTPRLGRASMHLQPNAWFHFCADHAVVFAALPVAVDRTLIRTTWLVHEDAVEGADYDLDNLTAVWRHTNEQDAALCARAQAGVSSPAYVPGPYAGSERQVDAFVTWYLRRLEEGLAR